jgi:hypothetical protein
VPVTDGRTHKSGPKQLLMMRCEGEGGLGCAWKVVAGPYHVRGGDGAQALQAALRGHQGVAYLRTGRHTATCKPCILHQTKLGPQGAGACRTPVSPDTRSPHLSGKSPVELLALGHRGAGSNRRGVSQHVQEGAAVPTPTTSTTTLVAQGGAKGDGQKQHRAQYAPSAGVQRGAAWGERRRWGPTYQCWSYLGWVTHTVVGRAVCIHTHLRWRLGDVGEQRARQRGHRVRPREHVREQARGVEGVDALLSSCV